MPPALCAFCQPRRGQQGCSALSWPCDRHLLTSSFNSSMRPRDRHFLCSGPPQHPASEICALDWSTFVMPLLPRGISRPRGLHTHPGLFFPSSVL